MIVPIIYKPSKNETMTLYISRNAGISEISDKMTNAYLKNQIPAYFVWIFMKKFISYNYYFIKYCSTNYSG